MSQIAQQDHLYVNVGDITALTDDEKQILVEKANNGVLLDVVLVDEAGIVSKILGFSRRPEILHIAVLADDLSMGVIDIAL